MVLIWTIKSQTWRFCPHLETGNVVSPILKMFYRRPWQHAQERRRNFSRGEPKAFVTNFKIIRKFAVQGGGGGPTISAASILRLTKSNHSSQANTGFREYCSRILEVENVVLPSLPHDKIFCRRPGWSERLSLFFFSRERSLAHAQNIALPRPSRFSFTEIIYFHGSAIRHRKNITSYRKTVFSSRNGLAFPLIIFV